MAKKIVKELAKVKKRSTGARNKRAGNNFEREVVNDLKDIGFDVVSSRSESKNLDDQKVDICDKRGDLPCLIQNKYTISTPNYFKIRNECPIKDKPFTIIWKKHVSGKQSPGTVAIIDYKFFLQLIKPYANGKSDSDI